MKRMTITVIAAASLTLSACSSNTSGVSDNGMAMNNGMNMNDSKKIDRTAATSMINSWPMEAKKAAMAAMEKYGAPDEATASMLVWHNNGPWKRSVVYRHEAPHDFPAAHIDVWEQVVN